MFSSISFIVFWSLSNLIQAYDWRNEDPSRADPDGAITCDNILPPFYYEPLVGTEDAGGSLTLLQICAQEQYGGQTLRWATSMGLPRRPSYPLNMGAYCDQETGRVLFQHSRKYPHDDYPNYGIYVSVNRDIEYRQRLAAYCKLRCRCSNVPSSGFEPIQFYYFGPRVEHSTNILLDVLDDDPIHGNHYYLNLGLVAGQRVLKLPMVSNSIKPGTTREVGDVPSIWSIWVGVHRENAIVCSTNKDHMPAFPLPEPANIEEFASLTELCAVGLLGGKAAMNAGAFCHRKIDQTTGEIYSADVWFSDEMTPLPNWMWSVRAVRLREHCWRYCRCKDPQWKNRKLDSSLARVWPYLNREITKSQWYKSFSEKEDPESTASFQGTSGGTMSQQSLQQDLKSLHGFLPDWAEKRLDATQDVAGAQICDNQCNGPRDCFAKSSASCPYQPQCRVDPDSLTQTVVGSLKKISFAYASFACRPKHSRTRLGGRDVGGQQAMDTDKWPCACNVTYVSHACCGSDTGQVWEASNGVLGILKT